MRKIISIVLSFGLLFQQSGLVYAVGELNLVNYLSHARSAIVQSDQFRPAQLRYISYDIKSNDFKLLLDKGDPKFSNSINSPNSPNSSTPKLNDATQELFNYFLIGLSLPNDTFWVNLRPDAADSIIDPLLEKTDIGKIFLESDLQLKKDTASFTSPQTTEGKIYWDKLYKKAGELFGSENITIPTITRPWIVPNEVIVRETDDSAYIYKATLKVMLEEDYLKSSRPSAFSNQQYNFNDPRLKELNQYSTQLIRETILPKLTHEVNSSQRYAKLRQVYYSLVLSRWFKMKYKNKPGQYPELIDRQNLTNLASKQAWDKQTYFSQYQESFAKGEYNLKETVASVFGQSIRSYVSGGIVVGPITEVGVKVTSSPAVTKALTGLVPASPDSVSVGSPLNTQQFYDKLRIIYDNKEFFLDGEKAFIGLVDIFSQVDKKAKLRVEEANLITLIVQRITEKHREKLIWHLVEPVLLRLPKIYTKTAEIDGVVTSFTIEELLDIIAIRLKDNQELLGYGALGKRLIPSNEREGFSVMNDKFISAVKKAQEKISQQEQSPATLPLTLEYEIGAIRDARSALEGLPSEIINNRYWWEMSLIQLSELLEIVNKIAKGYSEFLTGDLYVIGLRKALGNNSLASEIVREELRALGVSAINTASEKELLIAFNNILRDRYFPKKIDGKKYESLIHIEMEPLLKRALWPNSELASLDDLDYCRINRELLGIIYPREIRQTYALVSHETAKELLNDILPKLLRIEREVKENMERYKKELADFFGGLSNDRSINISADEKELFTVEYSNINESNDIDYILNAAEKANRLRIYQSTEILKTDKGKDGSGSPLTLEEIKNSAIEALNNPSKYAQSFQYYRRNYGPTPPKSINFNTGNSKEEIIEALRNERNFLKKIIKTKHRESYALDSASLVARFFSASDLKSEIITEAKRIEKILNELITKAKELEGYNQSREGRIGKVKNSGSSLSGQAKAVSSSLKKQVGGIDLTDRMLKIKLERVGSFASSALVLPEITNVQAVDLDKEFEQIQAMVSSSIRPSDTRILEFAAACYYKGEFDQRLAQVSSCIKSAHLADEISGRDSSEALRLATMLPDALYGGRI